jgi:replicative DNA helicase
MVTKFISALLRANRSQQDAFFALQIPRSVFKDCKSEMRWIYDYRSNNASYPSVTAFKARFPNTDLPKTRDTIETAFQAVLDVHLYSEVTTLVDKAKELYASGQTMREVIGFMRQATQELTTFDTNYIDVNFEKTLSPLRDYKQRVKRISDGTINTLPSPWHTYNELTAYSEPGEYNILASRTSIGKTWTLVDWAEHYKNCGECVLVITKEMTAVQMANRFEAHRYKLNYPLFRAGALPPSQLGRWVRLRREYNRKLELGLSQGRVIISGQETLTGVGFSHLISKIQQYRPTKLFVDGAYLILPDGLSRNAGSVERFTSISNTLKRIALVFKLEAFAIIQVNREAENAAAETVPRLKNIYGADAWAQDADKVILIGGKRGSGTRIMSLGKGRESNVGDWVINYQLSPYPNFKELRRLKEVSKDSGGTVAFDAV